MITLFTGPARATFPALLSLERSALAAIPQVEFNLAITISTYSLLLVLLVLRVACNNGTN